MTILEEMAAEDAKNRRYIDWVSVKDHLPKRDGTYLVTTQNKAVMFTHFYSAIQSFSNTRRNKFITHWAEKPTPAED